MREYSPPFYLRWCLACIKGCMLRTFSISTSHREEIADITGEVREFVRSSGISSGVCTVFVPHTTCGVTINENADSTVKRDILTWMKKEIPHEGDYRHSEGNSDAHIKTLLTGSSLQLIIERGDLLLGTWQGVYFCEFDGPRRRKYHVQLIGEK